MKRGIPALIIAASLAVAGLAAPAGSVAQLKSEMDRHSDISSR
jgi:hypothetical protein